MNNENYINLLESNIKIKLKLCVLNLANDFTLSDENTAMPDFVGSVKRSLYELLPKLIKALKNSETDRTDIVKNLTEIKHKLIEESEPAFSLMYYCFFLQDIFIQEIKKKSFMEDKTELNLKAEAASEIFHDFLHNLDEHKLRDLLQEVMSSLPCRMTRGTFEDYIKASLNSIEPSELSERIRYIYSHTLPFEEKKAAIIFPAQYEHLNILFDTDFSKKTVDELREIYKELDEMTPTIFSTTDCLAMLLNDINYMIDLATFCIDLDFATDGSPVINDMLYTVSELKSKKTADEADSEFAFEVNKSSEELIETIIDDAKKLNDDLIKKIQNIYAKTETDNTLSSYFNAYMNMNVLYNEELENALVSDMYADKRMSMSDYINEFEKVTSTMPAYKKKLMRCMFMYFAPCPYDLHKVTDYVSDCLQHYENKAEFAQILGILGDIMYSYTEYSDDENEHRHEHHHDCDCEAHNHHNR